MSYQPQTDFSALVRKTSGGVRVESMPTLDMVVAALSRAGQFDVHVGQGAPNPPGIKTVWVKPNGPSWSAESDILIYDTAGLSYTTATPALWARLFAGSAVPDTLPGDMLYDDGRGLARLPIGPDGNVVTSVAGFPAWAPSSASGSTFVSVRDFGAVGDAVTDDTAKVQAAIESLPPSGGVVYFPLGYVCLVSTVKVAGVAGDKSNVTLMGQRGSSGVTQVHGAGAAHNLVDIRANSGHRIIDMLVIGDRGFSQPVLAPSRGFATPATAYAVNDTVEVSNGNAYTSAVAASNLVYMCTSAYTSSASFGADIAAHWVAATAVANIYTSDLSYAARNGVYTDGASDVEIRGCLIKNCVYAGVNIGSGPVQLSAMGPGSSNVRVIDNYIGNNTSGAAGGRGEDVIFSGNNVRDNSVYGINVDISCIGYTISGNTFVSAPTVVTNFYYAILLYSCSSVTITGNVIRGWTSGIVADGGAILLSISGNQIVQPIGHGVFVRGVVASTIGSNVIHNAAASGITVDNASSTVVSSNIANAIGAPGIVVSNSASVAVTGNTAIGCSGHGVSLVNSNNGSVCDNVCVDNDGNGIDGANAGSWAASGNRAYDTRPAGSKTQVFGLATSGSSTQWTLSANNFAGNAASSYSLAGVNVAIGNDVYEAAGKIGTGVMASTNPAAFSAQAVIPVLDTSGVTRYVPAAYGAW